MKKSFVSLIYDFTACRDRGSYFKGQANLKAKICVMKDITTKMLFSQMVLCNAITECRF